MVPLLSGIGRVEIDGSSTLAGGDQCRFQVIATAGVRSAVAETALLSIAHKPAKPFIVKPTANAAQEKRPRVELMGRGFSVDFGVTAPKDCVWSSDREGELGRGYHVAAQLRVPGQHRISLRVPDGLGGFSVSSITVDVADSRAR